MTTIHDVASYIVNSFQSPITTMKLQKLVYFSQGWALAALKQPLFDDDFLAWKNGPVARALYDVHKGQYTVRQWSHGRATNVSPRQQIVIDAVLKNYGALSGQQLSEISHDAAGPWAATRQLEGVNEGQRGRSPIEKTLIRKHFEKTLGID